MNLVEGLTNEIVRVTEIKNIYLELPNNAGLFAAGMMETSIRNAIAAQASGDILQMIPALKDLKEYQL